jgi:signal transduction histidine kinase/ligand-binding sensor domain-containing protein/DNA-binding response OmpR family regulator
MKIIRKAFYIIVILLMQSYVAFAQIDDFRLIDVNSSNSLSHSTVECMVQDSLGFMWIGTIDGLNLFDGYKFRYYKYDPDNKNSISNNDISCLTIQNNRYLWIGTRGGGANRMDLQTGEIIRLSYELFDGLVRDIFVGDNKTVWIGTGSGLLKCIENNKTGALQIINVSKRAVFRRSNNEPFVPSNLQITVDYLCQLEPNKLLVGAATGIFEFHIDDEEFHQLSYHLNYFNGITKIDEDSYGNLWIASSEGVSKISRDNDGNVLERTDFNSAALSPRTIEHETIETMIIDDEGRVWVGALRSGLLIINGDSVIHVNKIIDHASEKLGRFIHELFIDNHGFLWVGQRKHPLKIIDLKYSNFNTLTYFKDENKKAIKDVVVQSITGKEDKLWVGSTLGIDIYDIKGNGIVKTGSIPNMIGQELIWKNSINALLCDNDRNLWIGSSIKNLIEITPEGKVNQTLVYGYVYSITEDDENRIWFGTWGYGIGYIDKKTGRLEQYYGTPKQKLELSSDVVLSVCVDSRGYLWAGTKGGGLNVALLKDVVERKGTFVSFTHKAEESGSISYNDVIDVVETSNGDIWLATGRGLNKVVIPKQKTIEKALADNDIKFERITEKDGLPSGLISSICEDRKGNLWLGTNNGLCKYTPETKSITTFNENDGLPSADFNMNAAYYKQENDYMFFGGLNGITYFQPNNLNYNATVSNVTITDFKLFNETVTPYNSNNSSFTLSKKIFYTNTIRLKHNENDLSFEFSALNYTYSYKIRYQYRLLGYNEQWIERDATNRIITYTNLSPGDYELELKATNSDGTFAKDTVSLDIHISPPFWFTWWAYVIYVVIIVLLLLLFRRYSIIAVNEKNKLKLAELEQDKKNEIFEAKTRFFINVSHEIRTPLTLINEPLQQLLSRGDLPDGAIESASMIRRNLKRLLNQVNQLLEFRKMETQKYNLKYSVFSVKDVVKDIISDFEATINHKSICVHYVFPDNFNVEADKQLIETIIFNLVSNAIKHLPNKGTLKIEVVNNNTDPSVKKGIFKILVSDNGPGIPNEEIKHIFERFYQPQHNNNFNISGTGIGLSIVKEYVEQHNGSVKAFNLDSGGCCFDVAIPIKGEGEILHEDDQPVLPIKDDVLEKEEDIENYLLNLSEKSLSMVIIEDDLDLSKFLKEVFQTKFKVTVFTDGTEASENIADLAPDIIICDLMLPGMNGLDLTEKLKNDPKTSHVPIIMLTAIHEESGMTKGLLSGADSYLTKPFNTKTLKAQVGSILKSREKFRESFSKNLVLEPSQDVIVPREKKFIEKIMQITENRMEDSSFEVPDIVDEMGMSHSLLLKKFKAITGMSLVEFIRSMRIKKAAQLFKQDKFTVAEVAYKVGFSDPKYFSKCFYNEMGERPTAFIKRHHV